MSEEQHDQEQPEVQQQQDEEKPAPPWGSDEEFDPDKAWRLIQNLRKEKDELKPLAQKARQLEEQQKSEQEKLAERLADLEAQHAAATSDAARLKVALSKGLTEAQARRLVGSTVEELEADADELLATFRPSETRRPTEKLRPGASADAEPEPDPSKIADSILGRRW